LHGNKKNILIIGASGLIGSAVAAVLRREGHTVTGIARGGRRASALEI
jgi:uncharacterized protein YbjT (DUF2867 family)